MKPRIIFKMDDFFDVNNRVRRLDLFIRLFSIKITWGIVGREFEGLDKHDIAWIKSAMDSGLYFFWNHGWTHEMDEFKPLSTDEAKRHIELTQKVVRERCGLMMTTFGAPCNAISSTTLEALEAVQDIQYWYYGNCRFSRTNFQRELELEYPLFHPRVVPFIRNLRKISSRAGETPRVLVVQGHPNAWHTTEFVNFYLICLYLKLCGYKTIFPSEIDEP